MIPSINAHLELIGYSATQPNTGAAAAAIANMSPSASLTIKHASEPCAIIDAWGFNQVAGWQQVLCQSGHDTSRDFRFGVNASEIDPRLSVHTPKLIPSQEQMQITIAGSNVAGDVEQGCLLALYRNAGINSRLMTFEQFKKRRRKPTTIQATLAGAATGVTGVEGITAETNLLKANTWYALTGMTTSLDCLAVMMNGIDFGNTYVGVPGDAADNEYCYRYFLQKAIDLGAPMIPYFNSANKDAMNFAFVQNENNISPLITANLVELADIS